MFECEVRHATITRTEIGLDIINKFEDFPLPIDGWCLIPWGEHCTECAAPLCFESCSFYRARSDGICRRFIGGIRPLPGIRNAPGYITSITFGKWGKLMAYANGYVLTNSRAKKLERWWLTFDKLCSRLPAFNYPRTALRHGIFSPLSYYLKKKVTSAGWLSDSNRSINAFIIEVYNPQDHIVELRLDVCHEDDSGFTPPFSEKIVLNPGMNRVLIPAAKMRKFVDFSRPFIVTLTPSSTEDKTTEGITLLFGLVSFVALSDQLVNPVKAIIWDLDNTLWKGILVEDGEAGLLLNSELIQFIKETEKRGIIHSIASKNNFDSAINTLKHFGINDHFVFPKISWEEKGQAVRNCIVDLNIGPDTVIFVDDQPFEQAQVQSVERQVRTFSPEEIMAFKYAPAFLGAGSGDGVNRRRSYQAEETRKEEANSFAGDYKDFLRSCKLEVEVTLARHPQFERIYELCQRTNQLNFSGNRYDREELAEILKSKTKQSWTISCKDRFGDYGIIGFVIFDTNTRTLVDLMFSCRVQNKMVDIAFLAVFLKQVFEDSDKDVFMLWRKTERNEKNGQAFSEVGFEEQGNGDGITRLVCKKSNAKITQDIVIVHGDMS